MVNSSSTKEARIYNRKKQSLQQGVLGKLTSYISNEIRNTVIPYAKIT